MAERKRPPGSPKIVVDNSAVPPHSVEAEQSLLGSLMLERVAWSQVVDIVRADDLYRADHRLIFGAIAGLVERNQPPDGVTVAEHLQRLGQLEAGGGREYIAQLVQDTPSAANVKAYAVIVREHAESREAMAFATELAAVARKRGAPAAMHLAQERAAAFLGSDLARRHARPLGMEPVASWAARAAPMPRDWILERLIPAGRVTSFLGNGGTGKTLVALQIGLHVAMGRSLFGIDVRGGGVLGVFCEDEQDELERRLRAACEGEQIELAAVDRFVALSRDGLDSYLCTFEGDRMALLPFHAELEATIAELRPRLVILDTAADLFAGDFMSTPQVRAFLKIALGGLCARHGCAILLLAHPSASGMSSGDGGGFSTAWSNSVRSRLYLRRPKGDTDEIADRRVLEVRKSNYAADGLAVPLLYQHGYFVPDSSPLDEADAGLRSSARGATKIAVDAVEFMREKGIGGVAIAFGDIFDRLSDRGTLDGKPETKRKALSRALKQLETDALIERCTVPRGSYRIAHEVRP